MTSLLLHLALAYERALLIPHLFPDHYRSINNRNFVHLRTTFKTAMTLNEHFSRIFNQ